MSAIGSAQEPQYNENHGEKERVVVCCRCKCVANRRVMSSQTTECMLKRRFIDRDYEPVELTDSWDDEAPLRRRAESVADVNWRLVWACMILGHG